MHAGERIRCGAAALLVAMAAAGCGGSSSSSATTHAHKVAASPRLAGIAVSGAGTLPAAVMDAAVGSSADGRMTLLGGLDASDTSTDAIVMLGGAGASRAGALPNPQHDAQAATLGSSVYVFGGGQLSSYDHILRYDPASGSTTAVGTLPTPASDVAVTSIGNTAYVVGGYTGTSFLDTIVAWSPGAAPRVVGHLPAGLRYAAVAPVGKRIIIAGGTEPASVSDQILTFEPATGAISPLGRLPYPLTHASAVFVDGHVVVVGGRRQSDGGQTSAVLAIDPATGASSQLGALPQPLSDAGVALSGGRIVVAGGDNGNGAQSSIFTLTPKALRTG